MTEDKLGRTAFSTGDKIALCGVGIAFLAVLVGGVFSYKQLRLTEDSLNILANKEAVSLDPVIGVDALMYKNSEFGSPKILIFNNGKVSAIDVVVQVIRREFDGSNFTGAAWGSGNGAQYVFDEIKTYDTEEITLPNSYIVNPEFNVIEVRIYYMRAYDKKNYSFRTFYFYGPENWNFKSWYNIKQAKLLEGNPFAVLIDASLKLPINLNEGFKDILGNELIPIQ